MHNYLTVEEFSVGYENLTESEKEKIILASKYLCSKYRLHRLGIDSNELLSESFHRFLNGSRNLPNDVEFVNAFTYALKSIAEGMANRKKDSGVTLSDPIDNMTKELIPDSSFEDTVIQHEEHIEREVQLGEIFNFFKDDEDIVIYLNAKLREIKPNEIVQSVFNSDQKRYESTTRRFRRGIVKYLAHRNNDE